MSRNLSIIALILVMSILTGCNRQTTDTREQNTPVAAVSQSPSGSEPSRENTGLEPGKPAPLFTLADTTGSSINLDSLVGKKAILLVFWKSG